MAIDHPDWVKVVGGGWRYLGPMVGLAAVATVDILPSERTIAVLTPGTASDGQAYRVRVRSHTAGIVTADQFYSGGQVVVAYVNPLLDTSWDVLGDTGIGAAPSWYLFADTNFPLVEIALRGQGVKTTSLPVVLASDQLPLASTLFTAAGDPVDATHPLVVQQAGVVGQLQPNRGFAVLPSASRTTTQAASFSDNYQGRGLRLWVVVTNAGAGSITPRIDIIDPTSGNLKTVLTGAAIAANGVTLLEVWPGAPVSAWSTSLNYQLGLSWEAVIIANNANPITYSVAAEYLA